MNTHIEGIKKISILMSSQERISFIKELLTLPLGSRWERKSIFSELYIKLGGDSELIETTIYLWLRQRHLDKRTKEQEETNENSRCPC